MKRERISLFAGDIAAAVTLSAPILPQTAFLAILDIPFGFGILLALALFGASPHDSFPKWPVLILASIINAVTWIALVRIWFWVRDFLRALQA